MLGWMSSPAPPAPPHTDDPPLLDAPKRTGHVLCLMVQNADVYAAGRGQVAAFAWANPATVLGFLGLLSNRPGGRPIFLAALGVRFTSKGRVSLCHVRALQMSRTCHESKSRSTLRRGLELESDGLAGPGTITDNSDSLRTLITTCKFRVTVTTVTDSLTVTLRRSVRLSGSESMRDPDPGRRARPSGLKDS
jgi:hypothetical protein